MSYRMLETVRYGFLITVVVLASSSLDGREIADVTNEPSESSELKPVDSVEADTIEEVEERWKGFFVGPLKIGGALRFNYIYKDWDEDYKGPGELALDTARINLDLNDESLIGSFEYRYYRDKFAEFRWWRDSLEH